MACTKWRLPGSEMMMGGPHNAKWTDGKRVPKSYKRHTYRFEEAPEGYAEAYPGTQFPCGIALWCFDKIGAPGEAGWAAALAVYQMTPIQGGF